jgi:transcription factor TGA
LLVTNYLLGFHLVFWSDWQGDISLVLSPAPVGSRQPRSPDHPHHHNQQQAEMEELAGSRRQDHHLLQHQPFAAGGDQATAAAGIKDVKPVTKVSSC